MNRFNIYGIRFLLLLCLSAVAVLGDYAGNSRSQTKTNPEEETYLSAFSEKLFKHGLKAEVTFQSFQGSSVPVTKSFSPGIVLFHTGLEHLFRTAFFRYTSGNKNILIRYRKADGIFPFHYFW